MRLLALEAGGETLSAALFEKGAPVASAFVSAPRRQTEALAPLVKGLLESRAWEAQSLKAVACAAGPGSFSGLRSSLAFGTGLALALPGLKLIAISTLHAWAEAYAPATVGTVRVLLDGRRGQAYGIALKKQDSGWQELETPCLKDIQAWRQAALMEAQIGDLDPATLPVISADLALAVGRLALHADPGECPWEPIYLRRSEAEILWEKLHPRQS